MPTLIDLFNNRPFRAIELTNVFNDLPPVPTLLGNLGINLFPNRPVRFRTIATIRNDALRRMIPVSPIGAPPVELEKAGANARYFSTRRLAKGSTVYAEEMQGILQAPEYEAVKSLQTELVQNGQQIRDDMELTHEHHRFGCVQGLVLDADGTTVLDNWFANWGVPVPAVVNFRLDLAATNPRLICDALTQSVKTSAGGAWVEGRTQIHALAGSDFFTKLVTHPMVERLYLNYAAAADLAGKIDDVFPFGGIVWHRWNGMIGNTDFGIPTNEARFFPVGGLDVFQRVQAPAEFDPFINTPGRDVYALNIPDRDRGAWVRTELYSYPLYICLRPETLRSAIMQ